MRKILAMVFLSFTLFSAVNFSRSFFGVFGKRASIMGRIDGSVLEVWVYPYKVLHDFSFTVIVEGEEQNPYSRLFTYDSSAIELKRTYLGDSWKITEEIYPALDTAYVYFVYNIYNSRPIELEFSFKPDLSPMWPACLGGKFSYWDERGYFVLSEATWKNFALIGFPEGEKEGRLPAHKLPGGKLRYRVSLGEGNHTIVVPITATSGKIEKITKDFEANKGNFDDVRLERKKFVKEFLRNFLIVETPDSRFNRAIQWAMLNLNFAFVNNPRLGEGLVAGYGLSGEGERPGFAWFFGGDGVINSLGILGYGDFEGVRKEIEFLFKYQRKDGKIPHEISQSEGFVKWFKDYSFPYFHGDTTLYFAILLDAYVKWSGDKAILRRYFGRIYRLMNWMLMADADDDGIVDTERAGTGASETGPLRQKMKTDILLAGLSIKAWEAMRDIWTILRSRRNILLSQKYYERSKKNFEKLFWEDSLGYYVYAIKDSGNIKEVTIWPAIPMRFGVMDMDKGKKASKIISTPWLSTDWGTRFLSSSSKYYDPVSYNNGAVWPFLTGFSSLALYKYGNPYHAFSLLQANVNIIQDFDPGFATELLSGEIYRPLDQSVPDQIWSSGTTISAFVEGLTGIEPDAISKKITLKPRVPLYWKNMKVQNLKTGNGFINLIYKRNWNMIKFRVEAHNLKGYIIDFEPEIPALKKTLYLNGTPTNVVSPISIGNSETAVDITIKMEDFAFPFVRIDPAPGDFSGSVIIEDFNLNSDGFNINLWGKGNDGVFILSDRSFTCEEAKVIKISTLRKILVDFGSDWKKVSLKCYFK